MSYNGLPNTGMNLSTPIYLIAGLCSVIAGVVTIVASKAKRVGGQ